MSKITFEQFCRIMLHDITEKTCIEIEFCIDNDSKYQNAWMGKMLESDIKKQSYWYGLIKDGSEAYDFESFEEFSNAKIFYDKSIKDIWYLVTLLSIDACDVKERLSFYLS